jgi:serine/threonine protein kinase
VEVDFQIVGGGQFSIYTTCIETIYGITSMVLAPDGKITESLLDRVENREEVEAYIAEAAKKSEIDRTDSSKTKTGLVLGTPSFMSPEQIAGKKVDGRSDLYSLGVMLFQLLTGLLPHRSDSMATLMHQIANEPAPDVRTLRPELPEMLADVVTLAVEKRPEVRYADGRQMASDLRQIASLMDAVALAPPPAVGSPPPDSSGFTATVKFDRADPRHNS